MRFLLELEIDADIDESVLTDEDKIDALHMTLEAGTDSYCASYTLHDVKVLEG